MFPYRIILFVSTLLLCVKVAHPQGPGLPEIKQFKQVFTGHDKAMLIWDRWKQNATYTITDCDGSVLVENIELPKYKFEGLTSSTKYYFKVIAYLDGNPVAESNCLEVKTSFKVGF